MKPGNQRKSKFFLLTILNSSNFRGRNRGSTALTTGSAAFGLRKGCAKVAKNFWKVATPKRERREKSFAFLAENKFFLFALFPLVLSAQVINIENKRFLNDTNGFIGRADLNFNVTQNTQQIIALGINVHMQYQHNKNRFLAISDLAFIKAAGTNFVNNGYQHLRHGYKLIDRLTWESFVQAQYNIVLKLDKRYLAGMGPRVKIFKKRNFRMYAATLYMFEYQLQDNETIEQYNHRLSAYVTFNIGFNKFDLSHTTFFQPLLNDPSNYRIASDSNLDIILTSRFNFRVGFNMLYDTNQPPGIPELVYTLRNGLSYKF